MKFLGIDVIKWLEFWVAVYLIAVGSRFALDPAFIESAVYDRWKVLGGGVWGMLLVATGIVHIAALILNGRASRISTPVRALACGLHLYLSLQFALFFIKGGAPWGAYTMTLLLVPVVLIILGKAVDDFKDNWGAPWKPR
ncbi:MAG: hypothetical protein AAGG69_00560 [Pseudomonadota bacterium]